jgi:hypothetical protein
MKNVLPTLALVTLALVSAPRVHADESVAGKWKAEFESQVGKQNYTFEFKVEDGKLTGRAIGERETGTNDVKIVEGKIKGDEISFVEPLQIQDNEVRVEYTGKLKGDEIKLHRKVADFAEYDIVAKRVKDEAKSDAKPESKASINSPAKKP